jgi:hypothetical protein
MQDDFDNPDYVRGYMAATYVTCQKVQNILDGKDDGRGIANEPWESLRRKLLELVNAK